MGKNTNESSVVAAISSMTEQEMISCEMDSKIKYFQNLFPYFLL
jgi:hypothetical protein